MALTAGSVSVADDGAVTKSDAAGRLYDKLYARLTTNLAAFGQLPPSGPDGAKSLKGLADLANDISSWLVTEMTTYAKARVGAAVAGLQKTPNPNDPATLTAASGSNTDLPIV